jgi:hypothetical protein
MPLLCYIVKYFFYIPAILVVWRRTTRQTGAFATYACRPVCKGIALLYEVSVLIPRQDLNTLWNKVSTGKMC